MELNCNFKSGQIIFIDKPKDWTSFDVVKKIRNQLHRVFKEKIKVGHAGTLDPMATGLLILATGKMTKELSKFQNLDKEYIAKITFGATTPTYDADSEIDKTYPYQHITESLLRDALKKFQGKIQQVPPPFSAKRVKGKRAYELARKGKKVELKPVEVEIKNIEILELNLPKEVMLKILVSKGTYIRSFAYDLGKALNSGAYLTYLRRTKIGPYSVENAFSIEQIIDFISNCSKNLKNNFNDETISI